MRYLAAIMLVTLCTQVHAQRFAFLQWGTDNGLPASTINDITEDPLGFIWLATDGAGLVRFDGANFTQPVHVDSLPSPFVTVLERTPAGNFWIGTERGPARYNGLELHTFAAMPASLRTRIHAIYPLAEDSVWLATRNGLFFFNGTTFSQPVAALQNREILGIGSVNQGLFAATSTAPYLITSTKNTPQALVYPDIQDIQRLRRIAGAVVLTAASGTFLVRDAALPQRITTQNDTRDVLAWNDDLLVASATNGIQFGAIQVNKESGLAYDRVQCLYESSNGTIWVGSLSGLSKLTSPDIFIYDQSQGLADERIHAVFTASNGDTWVGSANGASRFSANYQTQTHYGTASGLPNGLILAITEDAQGAIWAGSERGLARFDGSRFRPVSFPNAFVFALQSFQNEVYIGTATGLYTYSGNKIQHREAFEQGIIQLEVHNQQLLGLTLGGSIVVITKDTITPLSAYNSLRVDSLRVTQIKSLGQYGLAIAASGKGVFITNSTGVYVLDETLGLGTLNIKALAASPKRLWIGTDDGLYSTPLDSKGTSTVSRYNAEAGFLANATNERSMVFNARGELLIGTNSGMYVVREAPFAKPRTNSLFITGVDLFFKPLLWQATDSLEPWSGIPPRIILPYNQNYLTFRFSSPDFSGNRAFWRYKLVGQDKDWTMAGSRTEAIFTNIPPGKYTLLVERAHMPNFTDAVATQLPVAIVPPYYKRWWFISTAVVFSALIITFMVRYRINQLNARLQLETALAESERKALRLQMNPHFVFNALDAISGFIFKNEPKEAVRYLTSFAKLMRLTLESSREAKVPLQNELQLLKNYIELEQVRFGMTFTYTLDVDEDVDPYAVSLPPMLLQPLVENAILHGLRHKKDAGGTLRIAFSVKNNRLEVEIEDNGIGRAQSAALQKNRNKKSLATSITAERIALLSKSLGVQVVFSILDLTDQAGMAAGTRVVLSLPQLASDSYT